MNAARARGPPAEVRWALRIAPQRERGSAGEKARRMPALLRVCLNVPNVAIATNLVTADLVIQSRVGASPSPRRPDRP